MRLIEAGRTVQKRVASPLVSLKLPKSVLSAKGLTVGALAPVKMRV